MHAKFHLGESVHTVSDDTVMARLFSDVAEYAGPRRAVCVVFSDGRGVWQNTIQPRPDDDRLEFLQQLVHRLNKEAAHDGHWFAAWINRRKWIAFWRDHDGDLHTVIEDDRPFARMVDPRTMGLDIYVEHGDQAIINWNAAMDAIDASAAQKFMATLGEDAPKH